MKKFFFALPVALLIFISCSKTPDYPQDRVRIAIPDDVTTFNPMFSYAITEGAISELLFLPLVKQEWDEQKRALVPVKYLASDYNWENNKTLKIVVRNDARWSDGKKVTPEDVIFSLVVYSDPSSKSKFFGYFGNFFLNENEKIEKEKSFEIVDDSTLVIKFNEKSSPNLLDIDFPIIPKHYFNDVAVAELENSELNLSPVTSGPYKVGEWKKNSSLELLPVTDHFLYKPGMVTLEFQVVSDYQTRILKLQQGELDIIQDILPEDVEEINKLKHAETRVVKGRDYDYLGWNNLDPEAFKNGQEKPNPLFGNKKIREALSRAVDREQILSDYLKGNGQISNGPVTPIVFENYKPAEGVYNPEESKKILEAEGWKDTDNDSFLDKDGKKFGFDLAVVTGSKRKKYVAEIVKSNLAKIGVDVNIVNMEYNNYLDKLLTRGIDAWVGGWYIPLPLELNIYWNSNLDMAQLNFPGYKNPQADAMMALLSDYSVFSPPVNLLEEIQTTIFNDHPVTFLFWVDQVFGINTRLKNVNVNPLGAIHSCWEWRLN